MSMESPKSQEGRRSKLAKSPLSNKSKQEEFDLKEL